jgi:hypothetical protein
MEEDEPHARLTLLAEEIEQLKTLVQRARRGEPGTAPLSVLEKLLEKKSEEQISLMVQQQHSTRMAKETWTVATSSSSVSSSSATHRTLPPSMPAARASLQPSLARFGVTKRSAQGVVTPVDDGTALQAAPGSVSCKYCRKSFVNVGGRMSHEMYCKEAPPVQAATARGQEVKRAREEDIVTTLTTTLAPAAAAAAAAGGDDSDKSSTNTVRPVPKDGRRGAAHRKRYHVGFKVAVLDFVNAYEKGMIGERKGGSRAASDEFNIGESIVSRWRRDEADLRQAALEGKGKKGRGYRGMLRFNVGRNQGQANYPLAEAAVVAKYEKARGRGVRVGPNIIKVWMKQAVKTHYPAVQTFSASNGWLAKFKRRHGLVSRCATNKKNVSVAERLPKIQHFHKRLLRIVDAQMDDEKTGFAPGCVLNADQTPLCLTESDLKTYDNRGATVVRLAIQESSEKRFCTLQIMIALSGNSDKPFPQPRIALIFRGQGIRISQQERDAWHPGVDIYFQSKAWMDKALQKEWMNRTVKTYVETHLPPDKQKVLFVDNLSSQTDDEFAEAMNAAGIQHRRLFPAGCTDILQPLDQHFNRYLKKNIGELLDGKLANDEEFQASWLGIKEPCPAWKRRAIISHIVFTAYENVCKTFDFTKLGFSTGVVMVKTGQTPPYPIKIGGVESYSFMDVTLPEDGLGPPVPQLASSSSSSSSSAASAAATTTPTPAADMVDDEEAPDETEGETVISSDEHTSGSESESEADADEETLAPGEGEIVFNHHVVDEMLADDTAVFDGAGEPTNPPPGYAIEPKPDRLPMASSKFYVYWSVPLTSEGKPGWIVGQIEGGPEDPRARLQGITYRVKGSTTLDKTTPSCLAGKNSPISVAFTLENYGVRWLLLRKE